MKDDPTDTIQPVSTNWESVETMKTSEEVQAMLALHRQVHSSHQIAQLMQRSRDTATKYQARGK